MYQIYGMQFFSLLHQDVFILVLVSRFLSWPHLMVLIAYSELCTLGTTSGFAWGNHMGCQKWNPDLLSQGKRFFTYCTIVLASNPSLFSNTENFKYNMLFLVYIFFPFWNHSNLQHGVKSFEDSYEINILESSACVLLNMNWGL